MSRAPSSRSLRVVDIAPPRASDPPSRGRVLTLACCALLAVLLMILAERPGPARGDADPASDVLLAQSAFYPYQPAVSHSLEAALNGLLRSAERAGFPLKVAVIGSREDLGAIPNFFGHPESYARFLDKEISFNNQPPLLVVMPAGFGVVAAGNIAVLAGLEVDTRHGSDGLVRSAIEAVVLLARATGRSLKQPSISSTGSGGGGPPTFVFFVIPAGLLLAIGAIGLRRGRSGGTQRERPRGPRRGDF